MKVYIPDHVAGEGTYNQGNNKWHMSTLWDAAKEIEEYDLQLSAIDLSNSPWALETFGQFLYHMKRVLDADFENPVIQDHHGYVIDGWHRIANAILNDLETVKCKRLRVMPMPDEVVKE